MKQITTITKYEMYIDLTSANNNFKFWVILSVQLFIFRKTKSEIQFSVNAARKCSFNIDSSTTKLLIL